MTAKYPTLNLTGMTEQQLDDEVAVLFPSIHIRPSFSISMLVSLMGDHWGLQCTRTESRPVYKVWACRIVQDDAGFSHQEKGEAEDYNIIHAMIVALLRMYGRTVVGHMLGGQEQS